MIKKKVYSVLLSGLISISLVPQLAVAAQSLIEMTEMQIMNMEDIHVKKYEKFLKSPDMYADESVRDEWRNKSLAGIQEKNAISLLNYDFRADIYKKLLQYEEEHPNAHPNDANEFFVELCDWYNYAHLKAPSATPEPIPTELFYPLEAGKVKLDPYLTNLYNSNPVKGFKALLAREEAIKFADQLFKQNSDNDRTDAFRKMASSVYTLYYTNDYAWVRSWDATQQSDDNKSLLQNEQEKAMDSNNALVGRLAASNNDITSNNTPGEIKILLHRIYNSGDLMKLSEKSGYAEKFTGRNADYTKVNASQAE
ncbi:hypothetical protein GC093_03135 [Paenibacillus sp. LMG 31456]|uniref:DUF6973 domain-containing protein n=1 Tax=Paenibacillus foliorum TaxID=2654974 RepID=A0A972GK13_9BACL|nr:hypothetical protein [Paenibacillus foliorum]NOU92231.1 hypothetical protein [Paenibacillus foliorum]